MSDPGAGDPRPWWHLVLAVDLALVLVTSVNRHLPALEGVPLFDTPGGWLVLEPLNLVRENNFAAWWSATALAVAGLLAWERASSPTSPSRRSWIVLAVAFIGLSADEACSLHERVDLPLGWIPGAAAGALVVGAALLALLRQPATALAARRMLLGLTCFTTVAILEFLERRISLPQTLRGLRAGTEEGLELLGEALLLAGVLSVTPGGATPGPGWRAARQALLPRPEMLSGLRVVMAALLVLHAVSALLWVPGLTDLSSRGDPSGWLPSLMFLLASCHVAWQSVAEVLRCRGRASGGGSRRWAPGESVDSSSSSNDEPAPRSRHPARMTAATGCWGSRANDRWASFTALALAGASVEAVARTGRSLPAFTSLIPERALSSEASLVTAAWLLLAALCALRTPGRIGPLLLLSSGLMAMAALSLHGAQQDLAAVATGALTLLAVIRRPGSCHAVRAA